MSTYIAIEGLIGVGKTTLCHLLARRWRAELVLEPSERNPFLEPFYRDPERYAFPAQMSYLIQRWRQQAHLRQPDLFGGMVVSDYVFAKDRLFAEMVLSAEELELYDHFADALSERGPRPDLLVVLEAPIDVCMARIARRSAPGEERIERAYLQALRDRYEVMLDGWRACPVLRIDTTALDVAGDPGDQGVVLARIEAALRGHVVSDGGSANLDLFPRGAPRKE